MVITLAVDDLEPSQKNGADRWTNQPRSKRYASLSLLPASGPSRRDGLTESRGGGWWNGYLRVALLAGGRAAGRRAEQALPRAERRTQQGTGFQTVHAQRARESPRRRPNSLSAGWRPELQCAESGRGSCMSTARPQRQNHRLGVSELHRCCDTTSGCTNFIAPSASKNRAGRRP